jgi:glycosyltransferase involved in cell wall biosynthesis
MRVRTKESLEVVHVAETIRGGIATYLREILPLQVRRFGQGRVAVIVPNNQIQDLGEQPGVLVLAIQPSKIRAVTAWRARQCLDRLVSQISVRIAHVHSTFAGISCRARLFGSSRSFRLIYCPHGWAFTRTGRSVPLARLVERALSKRCDAIICVSDAERNAALLAGLPVSKLIVVRNGLPDRSLGQTESAGLWAMSALRLVFVGRLDRQKGFDIFMNALERIKRKVEVHIFGEKVLKDSAVWSVPDWVHMHGWQSFDAIEPYLTSCDALVMSSRWEGLPLTAVEAMRASRAVVASRVGGLVELVEDGVTGVLVPPEDAVALAEVLESVDVEHLKRMGERGRQRFLDEFRIEQCEEQLATIYGQPSEASSIKPREV